MRVTGRKNSLQRWKISQVAETVGDVQISISRVKPVGSGRIKGDERNMVCFSLGLTV